VVAVQTIGLAVWPGALGGAGLGGKFENFNSQHGKVGSEEMRTGNLGKIEEEATRCLL
jgi:hypothetical protein